MLPAQKAPIVVVDELNYILHFIFVLNLAFSVGLVAILVALLRFGRLIVLGVFLSCVLSILLRVLHDHAPVFGTHHDPLQLLLGDPLWHVHLTVLLQLGVQHFRYILGRWVYGWHLFGGLWLSWGHKP